MKVIASDFGESLVLNKKEKAEMKKAFKRFENSPSFKRKFEQAEKMLASLKNSSDPYTRAKYSGKT
jgi:hypothetical protein